MQNIMLIYFILKLGSGEMSEHLKVAETWLSDLNIVLSQQTTKENYEFGKKRTDALGWLINRVEELEEELYELNESAYQTQMDFLEVNGKRNRYKQALEEIRKAAIEHKESGYSIQHWALIKQIDIALEGESE